MNTCLITVSALCILAALVVAMMKNAPEGEEIEGVGFVRSARKPTGAVSAKARQ